MKKITIFLILAALAFLIKAQNYVVVPELGGVTTVFASYPFNISDGYGRTGTIYNKAHIKGSGTINKISMYCPTSQVSITQNIVIKFKYSSSIAWGGTTTYANSSAGATTVYNASHVFAPGKNDFVLTSPFNYTQASGNLIIFVESSYGGAGSSSSLTFICKPIDSSTEFYSLYWGSDNNPPSTDGFLIDYQPLIVLWFDAPTQPLSISGEAECGQNQLSWQQNGAANNVLVVGKAGSLTWAPSCFEVYNTGDVLTNGADVVYFGSAVSAPHLANPATNYNYLAFSATDQKVYSEQSTSIMLASAYNQPYTTDFDGGSSLPNAWTGTFSVMTGHGKTDQGIVAQLESPNIVKSVATPVFCNITANTIAAFSYRIVNIAGYPATATAATEIDSITVLASTDNGHHNTNIFSITNLSHVSGLNFVDVQVPLGAYAGEDVKLTIRCKRGTGEYFVDIDDFMVKDATAINENKNDLLQIYPNPVSSEIFIDLSNFTPGKYNAKIFDLQGKVCMDINELKNEKVHLDISHLRSGMYFIQVATGEINYSSKFIIP